MSSISKLDFRQVVPLGSIDGGDSVPILAQQREVEGDARRQREGILDLVAIDVVVAGN